MLAIKMHVLEMRNSMVILSDFHTLLHAISHNFHAISHNLGYSSHFWGNFNMLGIKMHELRVTNSRVMLSCTFMHFFMHPHTIFTQFWLFQPFLGQFQHVCYQNACTQAEKINGDIFTYSITQFS